MKQVARFMKVSKEQFFRDWQASFGALAVVGAERIYNNIALPRRATKGSAGYDFFSPIRCEIKPGESIKIPTGIRVQIDEGWVLKLYPRSSLGFKYRLQLDNTVGIIDSDYFDSDNEGHLFIKITNDTKENTTVIIETGSAFAQGVFVEYGITYDDDVNEVRNGGLGSTTDTE